MYFLKEKIVINNNILRTELTKYEIVSSWC